MCSWSFPFCKTDSTGMLLDRDSRVRVIFIQESELKGIMFLNVPIYNLFLFWMSYKVPIRVRTQYVILFLFLQTDNQTPTWISLCVEILCTFIVKWTLGCDKYSKVNDFLCICMAGRDYNDVTRHGFYPKRNDTRW